MADPPEAVRCGPDADQHTGRGIEVLFDLKADPRPPIEVLFDRMDPSGDAAGSLIGARRTAAARTAPDSLDGVAR